MHVLVFSLLGAAIHDRNSHEKSRENFISASIFFFSFQNKYFLTCICICIRNQTCLLPY